MNELLSIYQDIIQAMTNHVKICNDPRCCIRLVGEAVILGNYQGYISTGLPSKKMRKKSRMVQSFAGANQSKRVLSNQGD